MPLFYVPIQAPLDHSFQIHRAGIVRYKNTEGGYQSSFCKIYRKLSNQQLPRVMINLPDLAIHVILTYLDNNSLCNSLGRTCKDLHICCEKNYLWYEKVQNDFQYKELRSTYDSKTSWKSKYIIFHEELTGIYIPVMMTNITEVIPTSDLPPQVLELYQRDFREDRVVYGICHGICTFFGYKRGDMISFVQTYGDLTFITRNFTRSQPSWNNISNFTKSVFWQSGCHGWICWIFPSRT
jgi:hypothetical protein